MIPPAALTIRFTGANKSRIECGRSAAAPPTDPGSGLRPDNSRPVIPRPTTLAVVDLENAPERFAIGGT